MIPSLDLTALTVGDQTPTLPIVVLRKLLTSKFKMRSPKLQVFDHLRSQAQLVEPNMDAGEGSVTQTQMISKRFCWRECLVTERSSRSLFPPPVSEYSRSTRHLENIGRCMELGVQASEAQITRNGMRAMIFQQRKTAHESQL